MTVKMTFGKLQVPESGIVVLLTDETLALGTHTQKLMGQWSKRWPAIAREENFKGKFGSSLVLIAPQDLPCTRLIIVGVGKSADLKALDWTRLGGAIFAALPSHGQEAKVLLDLPKHTLTSEQAADIALGVRLRTYRFDRYKTRKNDDDVQTKKINVILGVADEAEAKKLWKTRSVMADGVMLARDLVNEPANILTPQEFAARARALQALGVEVEVLGEKDMKKLGMNAFLGVGQGSERECQYVIMRWNGGKSGAAPVAFIGKGVTFDSGGISIKPAASMEDMKGDMAGAAAVVGLMHVLAARKAKANVVGAIGLVENMPDGKAQRPGDIVTSMSGQTIEIINTDAEGRLVLADMLWHVKEHIKPAFMIDLATLTGAVVVALGHEYAGVYSNDDTLLDALRTASQTTGERIWHMPLAPEYDKLIDSTVADMKNTGGRYAGSITAAHFLKRFVGDVPWIHLDIAGTAMDSPKTEISQSWSSGFGVRLLDQLVRDNVE